MANLLLDTHVLIWWVQDGGHLPRGIRRALQSAGPERPLWVSDISMWEIAMLVQLGRVRLALPLREWLERATAPPRVQRIGITPAVAAEITVLPGSFPRDPADRILAASARVLGARLVTLDQRIIKTDAVSTFPLA
jgi:PIN domain nuclease of toxin-antitoxin system